MSQRTLIHSLFIVLFKINPPLILHTGISASVQYNNVSPSQLAPIQDSILGPTSESINNSIVIVSEHWQLLYIIKVTVFEPLEIYE